ncbi:ABC transporter ATP-binding protein [Vallitalea sp.]|jgi:ABC-2 type transport system ATP-binding protein|uniref:ABC transporter ATP-binding protein n=1 Tax=Vallitalea sp. TaxID=1882829 RepID=UPI0025F0ED23|nr:ABC transporter ATP-binding protein [Vallitalea sp.]MCT4688789.1 ABC transporter ATP-binding protein [Vallitalea sp.]
MQLLNVSHLKKYFKDIKAVDDISFSIEKGEILGLLGPNGAGKSTTISMLSTLIKPDDGVITYKGKDIVKSPQAIQGSLGYVPQEIALYPNLTGRENLEFWGRAYGLKGKKLKKQIKKVSGIIGITDRLKDKVSQYSGGMQRRLNIGAALLHEPELIIMDEPTVGIDPQSRKHILDTVLELNKEGMTVIYTSHYMEEVEYICNKVCIMDNGRIIANGTKKDLVNLIDDKKRILIKVDNVNDTLLKDIGNIEEVTDVSSEENTVIVTVSNGKATFKRIIEVLNNTESGIRSIDINEPNLETVFLHLTGKALRD